MFFLLDVIFARRAKITSKGEEIRFAPPGEKGTYNSDYSCDGCVQPTIDSTALRAQQLLDSFQQVALIELAFDDICLRAGLQPTAAMCLRCQAGDNNNWQFGQP